MKPFAIEKATAFVAGNLDKQAWHDGDRLPTLGALAQAAGVSRVSMWRAIAILKEQGRITARKGSRIYAGSKESLPAPRPVGYAPGSWEAKRILLEQDLLRGIFVPGTSLPSLNELQSRYGVCYATMRKILSSLVSDRIIACDKKKFFAPLSGEKRVRSTVCLLWEGIDLDGMRNRPFRERKIIESLESEYSHAGIDLRLWGYSSNGHEIAGKLRSLKEEAETIIGFIVRPSTYDSPQKLEQQHSLLYELSRMKMPIAILDELGVYAPPKHLLSNRLVKIFRIAGTTAGQAMGRMLLSLGHRRVAFVSHYQNEMWSVLRYQGLVAEYARAGYGDAVFPYTMESPNDKLDSLLSPLDLKKEKENKGDAIQKLRSNVRTIMSIPMENMNKQTAQFIRNHSIDPIRFELVRLLIEPLFKKALDDTGCTAWVAANDDAASFALDYLRSRKIKVPRDVALAGFDNAPIGFENGITSFEFDFPNITRQMLAFITRPSTATRFTNKDIIEVPGLIIHRNSTRMFRRKHAGTRGIIDDPSGSISP